jgi:DNA replication protein DnaC
MSTRALEAAAAECPLCGGTGWKTTTATAKANSKARTRTVAPCDCRLASRNARLLEQAEIPAQYEHCTLDDFDAAFPSATPSLGKALLYAKRFVEQYPLEKDGMLLSGSCGTGKTHLATAILRELVLKKGIRCLFRGYSALLKQIQATYSRQIVADEDTGVVLTEYSILQDVIQADVLVLDDLGTEKSSEWTLSMLYHVINERYNDRRTTIITTNLPWDAPAPTSPGPPPMPIRRPTQAQEVMKTSTLRERISERTYSRITEMCPLKVELQGKDYRSIRGSR